MKLCFDSVDELKEFVKGLKGTRGGRNSGDDGDSAPNTGTGGAPAPLMPPQQPGTGSTMSFAPQGQQTTAFSPPGFGPGLAPVTVDPAVAAIVARITTRIDGAIAAGQPADQVLGWFRGECAKGGQDATNATLDQIKQTLLAKLPMPHLDSIAKLMNA